MTAILGGQIDLTSTAPFADIPTLQQNQSITVLKQPGMNCRYYRAEPSQGALRRPGVPARLLDGV